MTVLAYIGPGRGIGTVGTDLTLQALVFGITFALIALYTWWAMRGSGR